MTLAALLTGCTPATEAGQSSAKTAGELTADQQKCVDSVSPDVEAARAVTPLLVPEERLDTAAVAGKNVWIVTALVNQWGSELFDGMKAAADEAGIKTTLYDGQGQVNRYNAGIQQAIAEKADGIILVSIDPAVVSQSLVDAKAAGIPVQNFYSGDPNDQLPEGIYGNVAATPTEDGIAQAKWVLANSGCKANVVLVHSSQVGVWAKLVEGAKSVFEEYCPTECKLTVLDIDLANVSTDVGSQLTSALQRDPDTNYVWSSWDSAVTFINPVLSASNFQGVFLSHDGLQTAVQEIVDGGHLDSTAAWPPPAWIGWVSLDDMARHLAGAKPNGIVVPTRILDTENIGDGSQGKTFENYVGFEDKFVNAWKG
ncbi:sugar ABC transporter substrate-binding protein [Arthrobacter sp. SD76]|uniref:sugar ABC transporter substrate-binding protein n=1 Tax=Arthrobacter sp. SD76 TaxID=3415007 RepID=UPI003C717139